MNKSDFNYLTGVTLTNCSAARNKSFMIERIVKDLPISVPEDVVEDLEQIKVEIERLNKHLMNVRKSQEKLRDYYQSHLSFSNLTSHDEMSEEIKSFQEELV